VTEERTVEEEATSYVAMFRRSGGCCNLCNAEFFRLTMNRSALDQALAGRKLSRRDEALMLWAMREVMRGK
jgi:hypothetical protein